jgi:hypothetical protein
MTDERRKEVLSMYPFTFPIMVYAGIGTVTVEPGSELESRCLVMWDENFDYYGLGIGDEEE